MDIGLLVLRPRYRVQQFVAKLRRQELIGEAALTPYLSSAQIALFQSMPASEQRHALDVLRTLQKEGPCGATLAQAALLHDTGKVLPSVGQGKVLPSLGQGKVLPSAESRPPFGGVGQGKIRGRVHLWHRVAKVLLQAIHPALLHRLAVDEPNSWHYPFFILLHHAACGAELAATAGTDPLAVALIRWHHTAPEESDLDTRGRALLAALRSADEQT